MSRALVASLDPQTRAALNEHIRFRGYRESRETARWLADRGHPVSAVTIWRHAQALKRADEEAAQSAAERARDLPELVFSIAVDQWKHRPSAALVEIAKEVKEAREWCESITPKPNGEPTP
ncbi:MAG: hypothetical protein JNL89_03220 [Rhodanobacteraceae bacterium]|nr:hypothetical protein [Rhodanobacteraceae bacterium]